MSAEEDRAPGHDQLLHKGPCPKCGSKDNLATYADGHSHCFSPGCGHWTKADGEAPRSSAAGPAASRGADLLPPGKPIALTKRAISAATCARFGYYPATFKGQMVQVAEYRNQEGGVQAQKLRFADKGEGFPTLGKGIGECQLFGQHLWGGKDRSIVITEGEIDAMSVDEAMHKKQPVVSINTGAGGAAKCIKANLLWLLKFEKVILFLDADKPGEDATTECVKLFPIGKCHVAKMPGHKDANAALQAGKPGDISAAIYGAEPYSPPGIINGRMLADRIDFDAPAPVRYSLPWAGLTAKLYGGIARKDVVVLLSGSGKGKTTFLFEIISGFLEQGLKVGGMFFEDDLEDILHGLLTVRTSKRLRLDPTLATGKVKREEWAKLTSTDQLFLFDGASAKWGLDDLMGYIEFLARGCEVDVVIVDPMSFLVAQSAMKDERRGLDEVMSSIASKCKQLDIAALISHHLTRPEGDKGHEEGADISLKQARGSNGIGQFCSLALGLRWRPDLNVTEVKCLKSRKQGELNGTVLTHLRYDADTGRVVETAVAVQGGGSDGEASPAFKEEF